MAQKQEVRLVEVPPAPPKVVRKKTKKPSLVDQAKVLLEGSPSSVAIFGEYDGGAAKAQEKLTSFLQSIEEDSLDSYAEDIQKLLIATLGKAAGRTVDIDDLATQSKGSFESRVRAIFAAHFPEKAEASAYSAAYQVNLGKTKRWEDSDPNLISEENPLGLKYYAVYRESTSTPGVYERVIGLRSHLPKEWKGFVQKAGSRKRLTTQEGEAVETAPSTEELQVEQATEVHEKPESHNTSTLQDEVEADSEVGTDDENETGNGVQEQVVGAVEIPETAPDVDTPSSDPA